MIRRLANISIRTKILSSSVVTVVLISLFILAYYPAKQRSEIYRAMQQKHHSMAEMISFAVGIGMGLGDYTAITEALQWARDDSDFVYMAVLDENSEVFASLNPMNFKLDIPYLLSRDDIIEVDGRLLHTIRVPVRYQGVNYGTLLFGGSLEAVNSSIRNGTIITIVVSLAILVLGIVMSLLFSRLITNPLTQLRNAANEVALGNKEVEISVTSSDEVGALGNAFNEMIKNVREAEEALRESEHELFTRNKIANVFLTIPDDEMYSEVLGLILEAVESKYGVFGYLAEDGALVVPTMTRTVWDKCAVSDKDVVFPYDTWSDSIWPRAIREKKTLFSNELSTKTPEGHIPIFRNITLPILHQGEPIGLIQVANKETDYGQRDIQLLQIISGAIAPILNARLERDRQEGKRKQAEEALRESEELHRIILASTSDAVFIADGCGKFTFVCPNVDVIFGHTEEEVYSFGNIASLLGDGVFNPDDLDRLGEIKNVEREIQDRSGHRHALLINVKRVSINEGTILYTCRDITERKQAEDELQESEQKFRRIAERSFDVIVLARLDSTITFVSPSCERVFGYDPTEMIGKSMAEFTTEAAAQTVVQSFKDVAAGRLVESLESELFRKDGTIARIEVNAVPILKDDVVVGTQGIIRDITERKRAEEELKRSEASLAEAQRIAHMGNWDWNIGTNELFWSDGIYRIFGLKPHEFGASYEAFMNSVHPDDRLHVKKSVEEALHENKPYSTDHRVVLPGGEVRIVHEQAEVTLDNSGKPIRMVGTVQDITERKQAEQELRKLSAAVIQSANVIVITDLNGIVEYVNPQFSRVTGYSLVEVVGKSMRILKSGKHDKEFYRDLWQTIKSGKTWIGNVQNRRKKGDLYWERHTITPIFDEKGQIINFLSVGEDITTEIITQQKLVEADKMSAIGMLAAGVAHEFKNYLAGIVGNASFALTELEEEGGLELAHETLSKIIEYGEKANDVAMSLLSYSRAKPEELSQEDLKKIIRNTVGLVEKEIKSLSIEIVTYFEEVPEVNVSVSKIQQLLLNLLINAQHAIKSNGVITVALLVEGDHVKIKVGDTGVGIPQENLGKIFDPFFTTKGVWGKDELVGTGMGLSICRNIAREHGGDLIVESVDGVGTTFTLTLPMSRNDETTDKTAFVELLDKKQEYKVLIFTLDKSIVSHYFTQACEINTRMMLINNIEMLHDELLQAANLVICDAKFAGKVELYKIVEICLRLQVPYVMVNCGTMEYQLADLYESSAANFKQLPDFSRIINCSLMHKATKTSS